MKMEPTTLKDIGVAAFFAGLFLPAIAVLQGAGPIIYGIGVLWDIMTKDKK